MNAKIAYFVMAHRRPAQLRWLVEALAADASGGPILLHVDLKSTLGLRSDRKGMWQAARALAADHPRVRLMRPRFTNWGGWSLSRLLLHAIDTALDMDAGWTHFVNLSGQCYPIRPLPDIARHLAAAGDQVFTEMRPLDDLPADDWHLRWQPMLELPVKALALPGRKRPPAGFEMAHKGSQWVILPRAFCEWQRSAPVGRAIRRYLSGLMLSDELVVQTLVANGPWRDRVAPHYGREIVWPGPKVLTMADWPRLMASPGFFARKFEAETDAQIVPALARTLDLPQLAVAA